MLRHARVFSVGVNEPSTLAQCLWIGGRFWRSFRSSDSFEGVISALAIGHHSNCQRFYSSVTAQASINQSVVYCHHSLDGVGHKACM